MSLITNIIHSEFTLVVSNTSENQLHGFEKIFINNQENIMLMIAGFPLPTEYLEAFKSSVNVNEAIGILEHYATEKYGMNIANNPNDYICQQCSLTYFDELTQKFCSYTISCTNDQRTIDLKSSIKGQLLYRCIGSENDELSALFHLHGVRKKMQQFSSFDKGVDSVLEIIEITQKMYDIIHLVDDDIAFNYSGKYWVMDKDSLKFQSVKYNPDYFIPFKNIAKPKQSTSQSFSVQQNGQFNNSNVA